MMSNMMVPKVVELDDEIASRNVEDYLGKIEDLNINMEKNYLIFFYPFNL